MSKLPKCTKGNRHRWLFVENIVVRKQIANRLRISSQAEYVCNCGAKKYGPHDPNG